MVVRNNILYGVYKLNGKEYEMQTSSIITSPSEPAKFDRVDLNRLAQTCTLFSSFSFHIYQESKSFFFFVIQI